MLGAMLTLLLAAMDNTIVGTAMPKIVRDLHGVNHYAWPFTAYMLCSTIVLPVSGKLADIYGRKKITIIGISVFVAASVLCGFSRSMIELSVLRGLQGIGGGVCISSAFIIVSEIFPPRKRGKYIGFVASMFAVASILGPGAGGVITDLLSWRWVFFVNIPFGLAALFLIVRYFPRVHHHDAARRPDYIGVVLFIACAFPLLFAVSRIGTTPLSSPVIGVAALIAIVAGALFLYKELHSDEPLLQLHCFRNSVFGASVIGSALGNMAIFGSAIYLPLYLQSVRGESAAKSGAIMMPMMISMIIASNISGIMMSRLLRYKSIGLAGLGISCIGMFCFGFFGGRCSTAGIILFSTLAGAGIGMTFPVFTVSAQTMFSGNQIGVITSLLQFFRNLGGTLGAALFGAVMFVRLNAELKHIAPGTLPVQIADLLRTPGMLASPAKMESLRATVPAESLADFDRVARSGLSAVSGSIEQIFIVASLILVAGIVAVVIMFHEKAVRHAVVEHRKQHE